MKAGREKVRLKRLLSRSPRQFCSNTQISNAPTLSFIIPGSPPPCATKQKDYLHPSLVFATIKIKRQPRTSLATQKAKKQNPPSVVRWSAVTRRPEPQENNNKQDTTPPNVHQQTLRRIPFTREQWQPRYLPSFLSNSNKAPDTRPVQGVLHEHATITIFL